MQPVKPLCLPYRSEWDRPLIVPVRVNMKVTKQITNGEAYRVDINSDADKRCRCHREQRETFAASEHSHYLWNQKQWQADCHRTRQTREHAGGKRDPVTMAMRRQNHEKREEKKQSFGVHRR